MKKFTLFVLPLFLLFISCSVEGDDQPKAYYELLPIQRCEMPYYFHSGESYDLTMTFKMPTTCHIYKGIYVEEHGDTKIIAIQSMVYQRDDCEVIDYADSTQSVQPQPMVENYVFRAGAPGTVYTFKIWTGKNQQGQDTYYDVTVPVQ